MLRITLEGEDAERYMQWRNRNIELAKENLSLKGEIVKLKKQLAEAGSKSQITLVCDADGNLTDVQERKPSQKRKSWFG